LKEIITLKPYSTLSTAPALLLALAYLLVSCGVGATGSTPPTPGPTARDTPIAAPTQPAQPTAAAPSPAIPPTATIHAGAATVLISYHKSGGIAGVDETLSVYADGTIELRTKGDTITAQADSSAIQALQKLLASPEFAALHVPMQPPGADQFIYELTVPGQAKPIVTADGADNPPVLRELIDTLEQLKTQTK
jgi:hypothetical protein